MPDPVATATPGVQGTDSAPGTPGQLTPSATEAAAPAATGRPEGTVPDDAHPALREERERYRTLRTLAEQAYVFDQQGNVLGLREDFLRENAARLSPQAGSPAAAPAEAAEARTARLIDEYATQYGLLPEQVKGFIGLARQIAAEEAATANRPLFDTAVSQMKAALVSSGEVPAAAAPYVEKWLGEAVRANPRAALTPEGRETIVKQALGDYVLTYLRSRRRGGAPAPAANTPQMLRPTPGATTGAVAAGEEALIRAKLGLSAQYGEAGPKERLS